MSRLKEFYFEWCSVRGMGEDDYNITLETADNGRLFLKGTRFLSPYYVELTAKEDKFIKFLESCNVRSWDSKHYEYENENFEILDGYTWHIEIEYDDIVISSGGNNAYPAEFRDFIEGLCYDWGIKKTSIDLDYVLGEQKVANSAPVDNECIVLTNKMLTKNIFKDVVFFSLVEGGAMGEPGAVVFYDKSGQQYYFNYVYGDVDIWKVEKMFPTFANCQFGLFGLDSSVPKGWNYINLGMGNHLIVHDKVYKQFCELLGEGKEPHEIYGAWQEIARQILNKK